MAFPTDNDISERSDGADSIDQSVPASVGNDYTNAKAEVRTATKGDDRGIFLLRLVVKVTMIAIAIAITTIVYITSKESEKNGFINTVSL